MAAMEELLPASLLQEVLARLNEESDLARCSLVSKRFLEAVRQLTSVKLVCTYAHFLKTRRPTGQGPGSGQDDGKGKLKPTPFKAIVTRTVVQRQRVECLTLEIDDAIQRQPDEEEEAKLSDLWLTDPAFLQHWVPHIGASLKCLSITDFGHQAQVHSSRILPILSANCKELRKLELGNLLLQDACAGMLPLPHLSSLTMECVGMGDKDLAAIMGSVPALESLSLVSVFGLKQLCVEGSCLLACCLVLTSTPLDVVVRAPKLSELRLQFPCPGPERLTIQAPMLASLEVFTDKRPGAVFAVANASFLKTLLVISPDLTCVTDFSGPGGAVSISNMVFEAPILAFDDEGAWEGILIQPRVRLPNFAHISQGFPCLDTLFLGPGLWYAMETDADAKKQLGIRSTGGLGTATGWRMLRKLVLHVLLLNYDSSLDLLAFLVTSLPSLKTLEIYFHCDSKSAAKDLLLSNMEKRFAHVAFKSGTWKALVWSDHLHPL